jgi:hypothetical protein
LATAPRFRAQACKLGLEGAISKRSRSALCTRRPWDLGEVQVSQPRGVRCRRLDGS